MGIPELAVGQRNDPEGPKFYTRKILARNTGKCVEEGFGVNLGAGKIKWPGWIAAGYGCDLDCDLRKLPLANDSQDKACAIHVIEHFYRWEVPEILQEWKRILKPGAELILELPCMDKVLEYIVLCAREGLKISDTMSWHVFWGDPKYKDPAMVHKWGYTKMDMTQLMVEAGFTGVRYEEPRYHFPERDMRIVGVKP